MKIKIFLFILALIYSLIFTIPNVIVKFHTDTSSVSGFNINIADDRIYGAIYKEIQEGNFKVTDSITYEYKDIVLPFSSIPFLIIGGLSYLIKSLDYALIIIVVLFSMVNFFIQYNLLNKLIKNYHLSILGVFLIPLAHVFLTSPNRFFFFILKYSSFDRFLWTSIPRRQIELFFFFLTILLFYHAYTKRSMFFAVLTGIGIGLTFETYIYYSAFQLAGIFLLLVYEFYKKNYENARTIFLTFVTGLIFSLPYFAKSILFKYSVKHSYEFLSRLGLIQSRSFLTLYISIFLILFLFIFFAYFRIKEKINKDFHFLTAFFIGNILLYNQHILTGLQLQTWHWFTITGRPWMVIMLIYFVNLILEKLNKDIVKNISIILTFFVIVWSFWANSAVANNLSEYYIIDEEYNDAFNWLNKNTFKDSVVLSPSFEISENIPLRTHNRPYLLNGFNSIAPDCDLIYRGIVSLKTFNISKEKINKDINKSTQNPNGLGHFIFHLRYYPEVPIEIQNGLKRLYELSNITTLDFKQFQLDYIIVGPKEKELGNISINLPLEKVYKNEKVEIFKVNVNKSDKKSELLEAICKNKLH